MASQVDAIGAPWGLQVYAQSVAEVDGAQLFLARTEAGERRVAVLAVAGNPLLSTFEGEASEHGGETLMICPLNHANAAALRRTLPWLAPQRLGLLTSVGYGDRLGIATPGHVRAARWARAHHAGEAPGAIFAQQSIREMARTNRTPEEVLDDATWGAFQEGWTAVDGPLGADADHLKTPADADRCIAAGGYSFYTIDPGEHVDAAAGEYDETEARLRYSALPWPSLATSPAELLGRYAGRSFDLADRALTLDEETVLRAAVKYGRAVAHTASMYAHLCNRMGADNFELEVSVDETEMPTSHGEHLFIASELQRLGVRWVSLAPRYVGRFEKGVDYIPPEGTTGMQAFESDFAGHAAIARALGPYKLSLHSGSDKYSVYGIAAHHTHGLVHLKTAGTSYVEALRCVARTDPALFREIAAFAVTRYETDRASYHVSASLSKVPEIGTLSDAALPDLLSQFDAREVLHVTFGSVLNAPQGFKARLLANLEKNAETYYDILEKHFIRHVEPLLMS